MFSPEIAYMVNKECHKDRLREIERLRLIQIAELQHPSNEGWLAKAAKWVGTQLMAWGSKLERHIPAHPQVLPRRR